MRRCVASWPGAAPVRSSETAAGTPQTRSFAEAPQPQDELDRLLKGFVERFGSLPISNAGPSRRAVASADGESA